MPNYLDIPPHEQKVIDNFDFKLQRIDADYTDERECEKRHDPYPNLMPNCEPLLEETKLWYIREFIDAQLGFAGNNYLVNNGHVRSLQISGNMKEYNDQKFTMNVKLPNNFGDLSEVQTINIMYTNLEDLPPSIGNLKKLFFLNLNYNNIKLLPESFGNLVNLRQLLLWGNQLRWLPESIGDLSKLHEIELDNNRLIKMPETFKKLRCYFLTLENNPLISLSNINIESLEEYSFSINNLTRKGQKLLKPIDADGSVYDSIDLDEHKRTIRNLNPLAKYYEKSPLTLTEQYCNDPTSLTSNEVERLIWESTSTEREILESNLPCDNEIIKKINDRLSVNLNNQYKILL